MEIRKWLSERAPADVLETIARLEESGFAWASHRGGPGTMDQIGIDFERAGLQVVVMADRGVWELAFRFEDGTPALLETVVDARRGVAEWDPGLRLPMPRQLPEGLGWAEAVPECIPLLESDPEARKRVDQTSSDRAGVLKERRRRQNRR